MSEPIDDGYPESSTGKLELIWGEGFMSPGGPAEVTRIVGETKIAGCTVLDVGCGLGGVDVALVRQHGAGSVIGIDVEQRLIDAANDRARRLGLADRITYRLVEPGSLPFADATFDVVFSKDAIIHVRDKGALYAEVFRVLRPGGHVLVGDWLGAQGQTITQTALDFIAASSHDFTLVSLHETGAILKQLGFAALELEDRHAWYLDEARAELDRLRGPLQPEFLRRWGAKATEEEIAFWVLLVKALEEGVLRPGHVRAMKPAAAAPLQSNSSSLSSDQPPSASR